MLSYRHGFHAGNHADVLKHITLALITKTYCQKEKPFVYFDTHSGAALYDLSDQWAKQTEESKTGIEKLFEKDFDCAIDIIKEYLSFCDSLYKEKNLYPGSPAIVSHFARNQDSEILMELHPTEIENLKNSEHKIKKDTSGLFNCKNIHVHNRNGFEGIVSLTPPKKPLPARGFVLIDPSYETDSDFTNIQKTATEISQRWHNATIAIWYPLLERKKAQINRLKDSFLTSDKEILVAELCVKQSQETGLFGSGMLVINPTYLLQEKLEPVLKFLTPILAQDKYANFSIFTENKGE